MVLLENLLIISLPETYYLFILTLLKLRDTSLISTVDYKTIYILETLGLFTKSLIAYTISAISALKLYTLLKAIFQFQFQFLY